MTEKKKDFNKNNKSIQAGFAMVVFLDYMNKYSSNKKMITPAYFREELGIEDAAAFLKKAEKQRYLQKNSDGGFFITEKGEGLLKENTEYLKFFNLAIPYVTIEDYHAKKRELKKNMDFELIMVGTILDKIKEYERKDDFESVANLHYDVGNLYKQLDYKGQAMYHYLVALYFEVSGLKYYDSFLKYFERKCTEKELRAVYEPVHISPDVAKAITDLGDVYYDEMVDTVYEKNKISVNMCTKEKFKELVNDIINQNMKAEKWQGYFHSAFNGLYRAMTDKR